MTFADLLLLGTANYPVHIIEMPYFDVDSKSFYLLVGEIKDPVNMAKTEKN